METVTLKAVGPLSFTRRVKLEHESGKMYYDARTYDFNLDNGFKMAVPQSVWVELENEFLDRNIGLRYKDFLKPQ